jgi:hypothetical protein
MVSTRRTKMTPLAASDEFWFSPITQDITSALNDDDEVSVDNNCSNTNTSPCRRDSLELTLPAAHHQLLSNEEPSWEKLQGYNHNEPVVSFDNFDSFEPIDLDASFCERSSTKLSDVKQQGGGSWLLGFARMREEDKVPELASLESEDDDESTAASSTASSITTPTKPARKSKGVSFSEAVTVQPIPHSSTLSSMQRRKMFTSVMEVRQNKIRNKREYKYDGCDWRNATEEREMGVDMVTGELVHPAHDRDTMNNINWS